LGSDRFVAKPAPQAALNPAGERKVERFGWTFASGDKVMKIENDYDKEVYNGDIGYIEDVDPHAGELTASFDGRSVTYGFGELDTLGLAGKGQTNSEYVFIAVESFPFSQLEIGGSASIPFFWSNASQFDRARVSTPSQFGRCHIRRMSGSGVPAIPNLLARGRHLRHGNEP
jgi:hypothetical protein